MSQFCVRRNVSRRLAGSPLDFVFVNLIIRFRAAQFTVRRKYFFKSGVLVSPAYVGVGSAAREGMSGHRPGGEWFLTTQGGGKKILTGGDRGRLR